MSERIYSVSDVAVSVERPRNIHENGVWHADYDIELWRGGKLIHEQREHNIITTEGKRYILDVALKGGVTYTAHTTWYVFLSATNTTAVAGINYDGLGTGGVHPTEYVNFKNPTTVRPTWTSTLDVGGAASITNNTVKAPFTIGVAVGTSVYGAGLVCRDTIGDSTAGDYLISYSAFTGGAIAVSEDDIVRVGITINM